MPGEHPDLADDLRSFLRNRDAVERLARPVRQEALPPRRRRSRQGRSGGARQGRTVRYFGDYELLEEIARGGMGVVYRARQVSLNRVVALKMILGGELATPQDVLRFRQEAEAAATWTTRTSCRSTRSASTTGSTTSRMKLIEGGSLAQKLAGLRWATRRRRPGCWRRWRGRSTTPTSAASCTAT